MAQQSIGFGLIGTGMAGGTQAKEFQHVTGGEMVAVCSRNEANVREFASTYGSDAGTRTTKTSFEILESMSFAS